MRTTKRIILFAWAAIRRHPDATTMMLVACASAVGSYVLHGMGL